MAESTGSRPDIYQSVSGQGSRQGLIRFNADELTFGYCHAAVEQGGFAGEPVRLAAQKKQTRSHALAYRETVMFALNDTLAQPSLNIAVLNVSDCISNELDDLTARLVARLRQAGHRLSSVAVVPDDDEAICLQLRNWIDRGGIDLVLTADRSSTSNGEIPPNVVLITEPGVPPACNRLIHDDDLGFIGVVDVRGNQKFAA